MTKLPTYPLVGVNMTLPPHIGTVPTRPGDLTQVTKAVLQTTGLMDASGYTLSVFGDAVEIEGARELRVAGVEDAAKQWVMLDFFPGHETSGFRVPLRFGDQTPAGIVETGRDLDQRLARGKDIGPRDRLNFLGQIASVIMSSAEHLIRRYPRAFCNEDGWQDRAIEALFGENAAGTIREFSETKGHLPHIAASERGFESARVMLDAGEDPVRFFQTSYGGMWVVASDYDIGDYIRTAGALGLLG